MRHVLHSKVTSADHTTTRCHTQQCPAIHCSTLQDTATEYQRTSLVAAATLQHAARHCHKLQDTARQCNTLQDTARHCKTLQDTATDCKTLHHTARRCKTLQDTATHYNRIWASLVAAATLPEVWCMYTVCVCLCV